MAAPAPHRPNPAPGAPRRGAAVWIAALLAALVFVAWDTVQNLRHYAKASAAYGVAVRAPAPDPASPTGYAGGRRTVAYPARWVDGQHWIMQAQQLLAAGEWRLRQIDDDNAPAGRAVHWGSPWRWWLMLCARADQAVSGLPLGAAAERGAMLANPVLLALLLLLVVPRVARRFGAAAAAFLALAAVATPPFYAQFAPDNMDHHGLIQACALVTLLTVLGGGGGWLLSGREPAPDAWRWLPDAAQARRAFVLSGIAGGFGMWVSAVGMIPTFAGIGLGVLCGARLGRGAPGFAVFDPTLWRLWGRVGGATSLACWLLEYFPSHLGWRLEVNHPLYSLAWVGAGEVLAQLTGWLNRGTAAGRPAWLRLGAGLVAAAIPAAVIAAAGTRVFAVSDPFLWSLSHDYTPEFKGLVETVGRTGLNFATVASLLPMAAIVAAGAWLGRRGTPALARAVVVVPLAAAALFWLMALKELRWWTVGYGFLLGLVVVLAAVAASAGGRHGVLAAVRVLAAALFAPGLVVSVQTVARNAAMSADDLHTLAERDLAHALRQRVDAGPLVVLAAPATTSRLLYFAGAQGLGTAYWENLEGMKRAAAIFAAKDADKARELVRAAGITHIVLLSWDDFTEPYVRLARGLAPGEPVAETAFGPALWREAPPPPWLRLLPDHLPDLPLFRNERVAVFEVTDRTKPEQALVRWVRHLLYRGNLTAARGLAPELERHDTDLAAQVALARVRHAAQDADGFAAAFRRIGSLLDQVPALEPEDRMDLVSVFAFAGRTADVRTQLDAFLRQLDETTVRRLTPGSLKNLLGLSARLGLAWPDPRLQELAAQLLPPDGRI